MTMALAEPPWPPSLSPLKAVDDLLRCGICFDYFSIAMIIPQCSHNYCSLCIRKFLSYKTQCPTCCVAVSESDLKNNRMLDELVKSFNSARQQLLQLVLDSPPSPPPLACSRHPAGKSQVKSPASWPAAEEKVPLIDSFLKKEEKVCPLPEAEGLAGAEQMKTEEEQTLCSSPTEADGKDNEEGSQQSPGGTKSHEKPSTSVLKAARKVGCPVCEVAIPEQYINKHLDSCLTRDEKKDSLRSSAQKRKPLSKVVYNLLSDRDLKKKLREQGLSTRGTRQQLVRRHRDFVHLYNAQCDSLHPKPVAEIVKELESSEKIRAQFEFKPGENSLTFTKDQTEEEIDEIHTEYRNKHRREFQVLVDQVNDRWKKSSKGKPESAQNTEVVTDKELPAATEHRGEHCTADVPGKAQAEAPDGQSESPSLQEGQRSVSPAPSLSSTSSSSSDILRDPSEPEITSVSSDSDSFQVLRVSKRRPRGPQEPEAKQLLPKSKRKKS